MARAGKYTYRFPRPMVTVDAVVFRHTSKRLEVLVVERGKAPFKGQAALPGGFVEMEEDLLDAAKRELFEETGLEGVTLTQLAAFGAPGRDPRGRNISVVFTGTIGTRSPKVQGGDDAARAFWIPARHPGPLAFDHNEVLRSAIRRLTAEKRR